MYNRRVWLNEESSPSSGSVVAYHGKPPWDNDKWKDRDYMFLEVSDCNNKIRLHQTDNDTKEDFINKLKTLSSTIDIFLQYLESTSK
jgi:hypothetical protein